MPREASENILDQISSRLMAGKCPTAEILSAAESANPGGRIPSAVTAHIERCPSCRELNERLRRFNEDDSPGDSSGWPELRSRVMAQLEKLPSPRPISPPKQPVSDFVRWLLRPWILVPVTALLAIAPVFYFVSNKTAKPNIPQSADNSLRPTVPPVEVAPPAIAPRKSIEPQSAGPSIEPWSGSVVTKGTGGSVLPANARIREKDGGAGIGQPDMDGGTTESPLPPDVSSPGLDAPVSGSSIVQSQPKRPNSVSTSSSLFEKPPAPLTASNPVAAKGPSSLSSLPPPSFSPPNANALSATPIRLAAGTQIYLRILWQSQPTKNAFTYEATLMPTGNPQGFPIEAGSRIYGTATLNDGKAILRIDGIGVHSVRYHLREGSSGDGAATMLDDGRAYVMWLTRSAVYDAAAK